MFCEVNYTRQNHDGFAKFSVDNTNELGEFWNHYEKIKKELEQIIQGCDHRDELITSEDLDNLLKWM